MIDSGGLQQAKLVLLGDMGAGKSSLVLRFVKGQFFDYQVCESSVHRAIREGEGPFEHCIQLEATLQESTIGAAFLTKTMPEQHVKFEIW